MRKLLLVAWLGFALPGSGMGDAEPPETPKPPAVPVVDLAIRPTAVAPAGASEAGQASTLQLRRGRFQGIVVPLPERPGARSLLEERFTLASDRVANSDDFRRGTCDKANGRILTWYAVPADELSRTQEDAELWVLRGARFFALPGTRSSGIGTSWNDAVNRDVVGLTQLGWAVVNRIYGAGGIPDVSRASDATRDDVLGIANRLARPVVALGSNARARADHPRNLTDAQLRAIGASDGLVGVTFDGPQLAVGRPATLRDVVVHVRHAVRQAGIEHVGIASGFNGPIRAPDGLENAARLPALARALLESGFSTEDVDRIFHLNAMRLLCPNAVR